MIIPIHIDTSSILESFMVTKRQVDDFVDFTVKELTAIYASKWENQAKLKLRSTRKRYIQSLIVVDEGRMKGSVVLKYNDPVVRMVEEGVGAFDMKDGFSKSNKKKLKKNGGWYLHVPFRIGTPSSLAESNLFAFKMPDDIYEVIKSKEQNKNVSGGGKRSSGLKLNEIPTQYRGQSFRWGVSNVPESKTFEQYTRKSNIYEGITRIKDNVTGQNIYMSFRTVSDLSDLNSWIHSGINGYDLAGKAFSEFEGNIGAYLNRSINKAIDSIFL